MLRQIQFQGDIDLSMQQADMLASELQNDLAQHDNFGIRRKRLLIRLFSKKLLPKQNITSTALRTFFAIKYAPSKTTGKVQIRKG